jgi:hypothetical protein
MWCLTVATNAIVTWTTEYYGLAVAALRRNGRYINDDVLAHIWPSHHENINFYGTHSVDIDGVLAKLDAKGYRPLRGPATPPPSPGDSEVERRQPETTPRTSSRPARSSEGAPGRRTPEAR